MLAPLSEAEKQHAAGLMRVNHVGEVCAQALYTAQAITSRDARVREQLARAAQEETDHLAWTEQRLQENDTTSRAIVEQMKIDEAEHGQLARDNGGVDLPAPVKLAMQAAAKVMTTLAYRV